VQITPDDKWKSNLNWSMANKVIPKNSLALAFMECQSFEMYLTLQGKVTTVNMWWKMFSTFYAQIVSDNNSERLTKIA